MSVPLELQNFRARRHLALPFPLEVALVTRQSPAFSGGVGAPVSAAAAREAVVQRSGPGQKDRGSGRPWLFCMRDESSSGQFAFTNVRPPRRLRWLRSN